MTSLNAHYEKRYCSESYLAQIDLDLLLKRSAEFTADFFYYLPK